MAKGRQPGDGRGRLGGRTKGTPNKDNPLKGYLASHSLTYFEPTITITQYHIDTFAETTNRPCPFALGAKVSAFDLDLVSMDPDQRVDAEIKILNYHLPRMQAATVDISHADDDKTIDQRLADLARDPAG